MAPFFQPFVKRLKTKKVVFWTFDTHFPKMFTVSCLFLRVTFRVLNQNVAYLKDHIDFS